MRDDAAIDDERMCSASTVDRDLVAAVMSQAICDANGRHSLKPSDGRNLVERTQAEAQRRIDSDSERPLGFVWCCHQLGLDPQAVRERISRRGRRSAESLKQFRGRRAS